jgi:polygalacturonase
MFHFFKPKSYFLVFPFIILNVACQQRTDKGIYDITQYGAKGNGDTCTHAIQAAINQCTKSGGGMILVPPGKYVSGTIVLYDNIHLKISSGAELMGSLDTADYRIDGIRHGLIYAQNAKNISITGQGVIDGRGTAFMDEARPHIGADFDRGRTRQGDSYLPADIVPEDGPIAYDYRPGMMLVMLNCEDIILRDVTFKDSPEWTIRFGECDNVLVDGISIYNNLMIPNSDGIHCTASRNIRISNCDVRAGDDAIIVTGFPNSIGVHGVDEARDPDLQMGNKSGYAENITVTNCLLQSRSAGIRVGYGEIPIRNCVFSDLVIYESNRGIGVFSRDSADISNIHFENIIIQNRLHTGHWWGNGEPIHVSSIPQQEGIPSGKIKNIRFNNITAESEGGIVVFSYKDSHVEDIYFDNVKLLIKKGKHAEQYGGNLDFRPVWDKKWAILINDIPGLLSHCIKNITIEDFDLSWGEDLPDYHTHGMEFIHSRHIKVSGFQGRQAHEEQDHAAIKLEGCTDAFISNSYAKPETSTFLFFKDHKGSRVVSNNQTGYAERIMVVR